MSAATPLFALDLNGGWRAARYDKGQTMEGKPPAVTGAAWFDAEVPGAIQYDLIRLGEVSNPYASSKAVQDAAWVHDTDWVLSRQFDFDPRQAAAGGLFIEADGIDTFADLWLNGTHIGITANAYRGYLFAVPTGLLRAAGNELTVHVKAHKRMVQHMVPEAQKRLGPTFKYKGLIRRYQRSFFSGSSLLNLGGEVLGIGIYKPIRLIVLPHARIETLHFETRSASAERAEVAVHADLISVPAGTTIAALLYDLDLGTVVAEAAGPASGASATLAFSVANPKLWWPRGYGAPSRYRLEVTLSSSGKMLSSANLTVGIRTAKLLKQLPNGRETFQMVVNGKPIHCRGHNLVPVDYVKVHGSKKAYDELLAYTVDSNSNMLRIWGGGGIESPDFYDTCDALGIMIWQDFYLHSNTYPDYDEFWVAEFKAESEELLLWLRNHPSLVLICGGNEQYEGWDEWGWRGQLDRFYGRRLTEEVLPEVSARLAPELPYIINSPHSGNSAQSPHTGDQHNWGNFYNSTKDPTFVTETCWSQSSFSRPETLETMMGIDIDGDFSDLGWPQKWRELTGIDLITRLPYIGGPLPSRTLRDHLRGADLEQAQADHHALSNLLMRSPNLNGLLYWPLNKGGPLFQFGCIDYLGKPLASYYVVKRLFADLVVTIYRDLSDIRVIAVNRSQAFVDATVRVTHQRLNGAIVREWTEAARLNVGVGPMRVTDLLGYYEKIIDRTAEVMKAELIVDGAVVSEETLFFTPLMEVGTRPNSIDASIRRTGEATWDLEVRSYALVKLFFVEGNQKFLLSDNYFTLTADRPRTLSVKLVERTNDAPAELRTYAMDSDEGHVLLLP